MMKDSDTSGKRTSDADKVWHKKLAGKDGRSFDTQLIILEEFFNAIGEKARNHKILKNEHLEGDIQLRCAYKNLPVKIYCLTHYKYDLEVYVKSNIVQRLQQIGRQWEIDPSSRWFMLSLPNDTPQNWATESSGVFTVLTILWDPDKIPRKTDRSDPWSTGDENRVFLANGIFIEGKEKEIEKSMVLFQSMSEKLRKEILETVGMNKIESLRVHCGGNISVLISQKCLVESRKPLTMMADVLEMLIKMAGEMESAASQVKTGIDGEEIKTAENDADFAAKTIIATCAYCTSKYLPGERLSCPNCGASCS